MGSASTPKVLFGWLIQSGLEFFGYSPDDGLIPVACVLGGPDRRTLYVCAAADWKREEVLKAPTGVILAIDTEISGVGRP